MSIRSKKSPAIAQTHEVQRDRHVSIGNKTSPAATRWDALVAWLFPPSCPTCLGKGEPATDFCRPCFAELPAPARGCPLCAGPVPDDAAAGTICGRCLAHTPAFDRAFAAFPYAPPIDGLIRGLKFGKRLHCARLIGTLLATRAAAQSNLSRPDCFVPVPLHLARLRQRGFNQAHEIACVLSRRLDVPLDAHCLKRVRASVPQTALPAKQRLKNPKGAFAPRRAPRGRFVAIVDDVMTTGATVNEAARVLRKAGAVRVEVWVAARVGIPDLNRHRPRTTRTR